MSVYLALFGWSFLAATILPLASEPMLIGLVRLDGTMAAPVPFSVWVIAGKLGRYAAVGWMATQL